MRKRLTSCVYIYHIYMCRSIDSVCVCVCDCTHTSSLLECFPLQCKVSSTSGSYDLSTKLYRPYTFILVPEWDKNHPSFLSCRHTRLVTYTRHQIVLVVEKMQK